MQSLSVIIPCYNEEDNLLRGVLTEVDNFLSQQKFSWEVIICNDKSTDNSLSLIKKFVQNKPNFKVLDLPKGGKAGAIWGGIQHAKYDIVLFTDMDQSTPLKELSKLLPYFDQNYDVVIGSRGRLRQGNSILRKLGANIFRELRNFLLRTNIFDTQCGFKAMKTKLALEIFPKLAVIKKIQSQTVWRVTAYDVEMLTIAQKWGKKIKEVQVVWNNEDTSITKGDPNLRYINESKEMIIEVWRIFLNNLKGVYEK
ncbi:MAG: glycosyltransferase [Candidatus Shapirobacteria bacterium]